MGVQFGNSEDDLKNCEFAGIGTLPARRILQYDNDSYNYCQKCKPGFYNTQIPVVGTFYLASQEYRCAEATGFWKGCQHKSSGTSPVCTQCEVGYQMIAPG